MTFLDAGAFLALYETRDQHHEAALRLWGKLKPPLMTSNHVIDEVATRLSRMAGCQEAADRITDIYASPTIDVVQAALADEVDAIRWMRKYADQAVTFTDCVSFAMMQRHRIRTAFTYDRHFRLAGFDVIGLK